MSLQQSGRTAPSWLVIGLLTAVFLTVSLRHLDRVPPVYEDEPWQASTGWKLATEGVFGSDLFTGFHGMEAHYYGYLPVHPLLLALTFKLAGLGLLQARLETVVLGLMVILLTYWLGRRLFDPGVGALAVVFMLVVRLTGLTRYQLSGILFLDMARIARYDMAVPVFGLSALHLYLSAKERDSPLLFVLAGGLAGLAGLSHLYGAFWVLMLAVLAMWQGSRWHVLALLSAGFLAPWLPYAAYVAGGFEDWLGQTRLYAPRFDLANPGWYLGNLLAEPRRYGPGLGPPGWSYLLRPGFWSALVIIPASAVGLAVRAVRHGDRSARTLLVPLVGFPILFALFLHLKLVNYTLTFLPVGALAAAWGARSAYRWSGSSCRGLALRASLLALLLAVCLEGASRIASVERAAGNTSSYRQFIENVGPDIEPGSSVLGLHNYWLGMEHTDYRSWAVPLLLDDPTNPPAPIPTGVTLSAFDPDVILIDDRMRAYFEQHAVAGSSAQQALAWMDSRGYRLVRVVEDPTYGRMEIYRVGP